MNRSTPALKCCRPNESFTFSGYDPAVKICFPIFLSLFVFLLLSALLSCKHDAQEAPASLRLLVISPHGSDIRREFSDAFSAWHQKKYGTPVKVEWPDIGGTSNVLKVLNAAYDKGDNSLYDIVFGGGSASFKQLAQQKDSAGNSILVRLPALPIGEHDPIDDIQASLFGNPLHGDGGVWVAATMSRFGISINKDRLTELRLNPPRTWESLAQPEWLDRLSLADPSKSGSVRTCYEQVFQTYGWEKGWAIVTGMFANTVLIREGGSNPSEDVGNADAVAGVVIDQFGQRQVSRTGSRIVGFLVPAGADGQEGGGSVLDPDPIALLRGAPQPELAAQFIRFVVSPEGQRLWVLRAGTQGGPQKSSLGRLSVLPSLYQTDAEKMLDPTNPFAAASALEVDNTAQSLRAGFIGDLIKAALIDNHDALVRARKAILAAGDPPELLDQLFAPPPYHTAGVEGNGSDLPIHAGELKKVATDYNPPKGEPKAAIAERIQNDVRDYWRDQFAKRFAEVEKFATIHKR